MTALWELFASPGRWLDRHEERLKASFEKATANISENQKKEPLYRWMKGLLDDVHDVVKGVLDNPRAEKTFPLSEVGSVLSLYQRWNTSLRNELLNMPKKQWEKQKAFQTTDLLYFGDLFLMVVARQHCSVDEAHQLLDFAEEQTLEWSHETYANDPDGQQRIDREVKIYIQNLKRQVDQRHCPVSVANMNRPWFLRLCGDLSKQLREMRMDVEKVPFIKRNLSAALLCRIAYIAEHALGQWPEYAPHHPKKTYDFKKLLIQVWNVNSQKEHQFSLWYSFFHSKKQKVNHDLLLTLNHKVAQILNQYQHHELPWRLHWGVWVLQHCSKRAAPLGHWLLHHGLKDIDINAFSQCVIPPADQKMLDEEQQKGVSGGLLFDLSSRHTQDPEARVAPRAEVAASSRAAFRPSAASVPLHSPLAAHTPQPRLVP